MAEQKITFGAVLGFVGGLVILIYGAYEIYLGETDSSLASIGGFPVSSLSSVIGVGLVGVVFGILIMVASVILASYPEYGFLLGALMIAFSLVSLVSVGGGDGVGFLLAVVGGACGIAFGEPESPVRPAHPAPSTQQHAPEPTRPMGNATAPLPPPASSVQSSLRLFKGCPECGNHCPADAVVCPSCGHAV